MIVVSYACMDACIEVNKCTRNNIQYPNPSLRLTHIHARSENNLWDFLTDPFFTAIHLNTDLALYEVHRACLLFFSSLFISESESESSLTHE